MKELEKKVQVEGVTRREVMNGEYAIRVTSGQLKSRIALNKVDLDRFHIRRPFNLVGEELLIELKPKAFRDLDSLEPDDVLIEEVSTLQRRRYLYSTVPPAFHDETVYRLALRTPSPSGTLSPIPCPYYAIKLELTPPEHKQMMRLPAAAVLALKLKWLS